MTDFLTINIFIIWASTNPHKLKKLYNQQKHADKIICKEDMLTHAKPLMVKLNILYFMLKIKLNLTPNVFLNKLKQLKHNKFVMPQKQLKISKFTIRDSLCTTTFKTTTTHKLHNFTNIISLLQ